MFRNPHTVLFYTLSFLSIAELYIWGFGALSRIKEASVVTVDSIFLNNYFSLFRLVISRKSYLEISILAQSILNWFQNRCVNFDDSFQSDQIVVILCGCNLENMGIFNFTNNLQFMGPELGRDFIFYLPFQNTT